MENDKGRARFWCSHPADIEKVMVSIGEEDVVLEIGGALKPFSRADHVVDAIPYHERNRFCVKGWSAKRFSRQTWRCLDVSSEALPFDDGSIDFVFCSHTLSRLRDPIFLCREINRVGKRGFFDFPSKWIECQRNVDGGNIAEYYAGYINHRWLIEESDGRLVFTPKTALATTAVYEKKERIGKFMESPRIWTSSFFWEGGFDFEEKPVYSAKDVLDDLRLYFESFDYSPFEEELARMRRARKLSGEKYDKMLVRAWQHNKSGRFHLAIKFLREILRCEPDNVNAIVLLELSAGGTRAESQSRPDKATRKQPVREREPVLQ